MTQDHKELLSPAINMVDAQIKKIRMSVDRTGSSKAKGDCNIAKVEGSNDTKELLATFMKKSDSYCGKMAMKGRLERFMNNVTSKIERRQHRKDEVMKVIELQMRKLSTGTAGPCTQRDLQTVIEDMMQLAEGIGSAQKEYVMLCNINTLLDEMPVDNNEATKDLGGLAAVAPPVNKTIEDVLVVPCLNVDQLSRRHRSRNRQPSRGPMRTSTPTRGNSRALSPCRYTGQKTISDCVYSTIHSRPRSQCISKLDSHNRSVLKEWTETVSSMFLGDTSKQCNVASVHDDGGVERWRRKLYRLIRNALIVVGVVIVFFNLFYTVEPFHVYRNGSPVV